jgi:hypothetical protein
MSGYCYLALSATPKIGHDSRAMAQSKPRSALTLTHSLDKAKARYPWAKAWVQVRGGFLVLRERGAEARGYEAGFHEPFVGREQPKPKQ